MIDGQKEMGDCWYTAPLDQVFISSFLKSEFEFNMFHFSFVGLDS